MIHLSFAGYSVHLFYCSTADFRTNISIVAFSEMKNLYGTAPSALKAALHARLEKMYRCRGTDCN